MMQEVIHKDVDLRKKRIMESFKNFFVVCSCVIIAMVFMSNFCYADKVEKVEYSDVFSEFDHILNYVQNRLLELSTAGVVIAVAIGVFQKKFSMGKPESIEKGNKLIKESLIAFLFLNSMPVIVKTIKGFTSGTFVS